jgi:hypothetical protein
VPVNPLASLEADDIFISYSRDDGSAYVVGLDAALSAREFSCFTDRLGTDADPHLPDSLLAKIRGCKTLVLVGSPVALQRPDHLAPEVAEFARVNGTARIVSVSFDGPASSDRPLDDWSETPWYRYVVGKVREREDPQTLATGVPSPAIVDAIVAISDYMKGKDRLRLYQRRAVWTLAVLLALIVGVSVATLVITSRAADERAIAESRRLANQSQTMLRQSSGTLQRSIALAIQAITAAAARGQRTIESDEALRAGLALLPQLLQRHHYDADVTALSPDARLLAVLTRDGDLRIYEVGSRTPLRHVAGMPGRAIAINSGGTRAAVVVADDTVRILNLATNRSHPITLKSPDPEDDLVSVHIESVALSPDGRYLGMISSVRDEATQSGMAEIENELNDASIWDAERGRLIKALSAGERHHAIVFSPTGDLGLATGTLLRGEYSGATGQVSIWPLSRGRLEQQAGRLLQAGDFAEVQTQSYGAEVYRLAVGPEAASYATESAVWKRNAIGGFSESAKFPIKEGSTPNVVDLAFASDGRSLTVVKHVRAAGDADGRGTVSRDLDV